MVVEIWEGEYLNPEHVSAINSSTYERGEKKDWSYSISIKLQSSKEISYSWKTKQDRDHMRQKIVDLCNMLSLPKTDLQS
jgi:hypothetical protein